MTVDLFVIGRPLLIQVNVHWKLLSFATLIDSCDPPFHIPGRSLIHRDLKLHSDKRKSPRFFHAQRPTLWVKKEYFAID